MKLKSYLDSQQVRLLFFSSLSPSSFLLQYSQQVPIDFELERLSLSPPSSLFSPVGTEWDPPSLLTSTLDRERKRKKERKEGLLSLSHSGYTYSHCRYSTVQGMTSIIMKKCLPDSYCTVHFE